MIQSINVQRIRKIILVLTICFLFGSVIQASGHHTGTAVTVLQVHQRVSTLTVHQAEQFTMKLSIKNIYGFQDIHNVSISATIPSEVEFLNSSEPAVDDEIKNDTDELNHDFGILQIDETIHFSVTYNTTSAETKSLTFDPVNVSYSLEHGIAGYILSNSVEIGLRGKKTTTTTQSLLPLPSGEILAHPILSIIGYTLPLMAFSISAIYFRRIRY